MKGVDTLGGLRPPKPPRGGSCQWQFWIISLNICTKRKLNFVLSKLLSEENLKLSSVPIRTFKPKAFFSHEIENSTVSYLARFQRFFMTFQSARSNLVNLDVIKKIESSFVPIRLLTKIEIFQSDRIISWDLSSYKKKLIWTTKYAQTCNWFFFGV